MKILATYDTAPSAARCNQVSRARTQTLSFNIWSQKLALKRDKAPEKSLLAAEDL